MSKFFSDKCCKSIFGHISIYTQNDKKNVTFVVVANVSHVCSISILPKLLFPFDFFKPIKGRFANLLCNVGKYTSDLFPILYKNDKFANCRGFINCRLANKRHKRKRFDVSTNVPNGLPGFICF